ncbi:LysR family transcriptional regulator [Brevibacillus fluminis]|uniref:LysR family transcriptional regulator n=1 Tax=Brevibacillus fluminis TaxID=511487 RepID=A0A3M8DWS9_9BACL|nr:LysR family transcriptional regulator [Brevibacillus fluminis]RNB91979.1 LysR family transcriptional regulator [Brevibacillus fluminis]
MDIRELQYVMELARLRSFTKAAEALHITQPTLSKMIRNLEAELGLVLFSRIGKKIECTDAGRVVVAHALTILDSFQSLTRELDDLTTFTKGTIRIGLPPMVGASFFPTVMSQFRAKYPGLDIHMVEEGSKKLEAEIESGGLDMAVVQMPVNDELFDSHVLVKENLRLIVHPTHPLAQRDEVTLAELADESFVFFSKSFTLHDRIIEECKRVGFTPHVLYESSHWDFIQEMVAVNLGVAFLPETICRSLQPNRVQSVTLVKPAIPWHLAMIWRKNTYLSLAAREWIRFTQSLFNNFGTGTK